MFARVLILGLCSALLSMVFILRLGQLQLIRGDEYASDAFDARFSIEVLPARRGRILDRNGMILADNRTIFNLAVVLNDLSLSHRQRLRTPIWRFDNESLNLLSAHIAQDTGRSLLTVRQQLSEELLLNPGVALRWGSRSESLQLGLLAIPRVILIQAEEGGEAAVDPGWEALANAGLLLVDVREAILREWHLRRGQRAHIFSKTEWEGLLQGLAQAYHSSLEHIRSLSAPYAPLLSLEHIALPESQRSWHILSEDRHAQLEETLARFFAVSTRELRETLRQLIESRPTAAQENPWLFVPSAQINLLARHLPDDAEVRELPLKGDLNLRERLFLIQGSHPDEPNQGMYQLLLQRLMMGLEIPAHRNIEWLAALIERYGERLHVRRSEREHRIHHLLFDAQILHRHCHTLAQQLAQSRPALSPLAIEQQITMARRLADRDWRGQTRFDPLVIVEDVEASVANRLAGMGGGLPHSLARRFEGGEASIPGLHVLTDIGREYPYPGHASHIIGYLGKLSSVYDHSTALAMGLDPRGWLGRSGLEAQYDELLQGSNGQRTRLRTPEGLRILDEVAPVAGMDLELTLDMELQIIAEASCLRWHQLASELQLNTPRMDAAHERVNHGRAAMVLVDVRDGGILALASSPGHDIYSIRSEYHLLADPRLHPGQPLIDHASNASHPPGSTMKPLVTLVALATGNTHPGEVFFSRGYMARSPSGQPILREFQPFTPREFTIPESLARSSNVVSATLAERVGPAQLTQWMQAFGFGERSAQDVGWQRPGLLPTPANIAQIRPNEPTWYPSDTWRAGIGQFAAASPLQLVSIPLAVANEGRIIRPYLWQQAPREATDEGPDRLPISPTGLAAVQQGMEMVTQPGGTATALRLAGAAAGIPVAAKTGTSEWGTPATRDHARAMRDPSMTWTPSHGWLIGYAPTDRPQVAFAIFVYGGTSGGRAGTGIAKNVLEAYFERYPPQ